MRLSRLLPCVVVGGMIGVSVFGQSAEEPGPVAESYRAPDVEVAEEAPAPPDRVTPSTAESVAREEQELRKQYLQLIEQKTGLMDRSELREVISRTERDIDELKAAEKLREARQLLLELVKSHPETNAARSARAMLQAMPDEASDAPFYDESGPVPMPLRQDQSFERPGSVGSFPQPIVPYQSEPEGSFAPAPRKKQNNPFAPAFEP